MQNCAAQKKERITSLMKATRKHAIAHTAPAQKYQFSYFCRHQTFIITSNKPHNKEVQMFPRENKHCMKKHAQTLYMCVVVCVWQHLQVHPWCWLSTATLENSHLHAWDVARKKCSKLESRPLKGLEPSHAGPAPMLEVVLLESAQGRCGVRTGNNTDKLCVGVGGRWVGGWVHKGEIVAGRETRALTCTQYEASGKTFLSVAGATRIRELAHSPDPHKANIGNDCVWFRIQRNKSLMGTCSGFSENTSLCLFRTADHVSFFP